MLSLGRGWGDYLAGSNHCLCSVRLPDDQSIPHPVSAPKQASQKPVLWELPVGTLDMWSNSFPHREKLRAEIYHLLSREELWLCLHDRQTSPLFCVVPRLPVYTGSHHLSKTGEIEISPLGNTKLGMSDLCSNSLHPWEEPESWGFPPDNLVLCYNPLLDYGESRFPLPTSFDIAGFTLAS